MNSIITLSTSGVQIECLNNTSSLLDILLSHRVFLEYQCRGGYCGSCRIRLLKGKVIYYKKPIACLHSNEILLCFCKADGDIEIDI